MDSKRKALLKARAEVLKALGHPTRLLIVDELARSERCVCELTDMVGADISTVSKHLSILRNAGIVADEKQGTKVFYRLTVPCAATFFQCVDRILRTRLKEGLASLK